MKADVHFLDALVIALFVGFLRLVEDRLQLADVLCRHLVHGGAQDHLFHVHAEGDYLFLLRRGQQEHVGQGIHAHHVFGIGNVGAPATHDVHDSQRRKDLAGFPHGGTAHMQRFHQLFFRGDLVARLVFFVFDVLDDRVDHAPVDLSLIHIL